MGEEERKFENGQNLDTESSSLENATGFGHESLENFESEQKLEPAPGTPANNTPIDDNKERSNLGRKVAGMQATIDELMLNINVLTEKLEQSRNRVDNNENDDILNAAEDPSKVPLTTEALEAYLKKREEEQNKKQKQYESLYMQNIYKLGDDFNDEEHGKIVDIMLKSFNTVVTGDPRVDSELNFLKAVREFTRSSRNNLRGDNSSIPLDLPSGHSENNGERLAIKLDPEAKEFAEKIGMSVSSINKVLGTR